MKKGIRGFWAFCIEHKVFQKGIVLSMSFVYPYVCNWGVVRDHPFLSWAAFLCLLGLFFLLLYVFTDRKFNFYNDNFCYYTVTSRLPSIYKKYTNRDWNINAPIYGSTLWSENKTGILPDDYPDGQVYVDLYNELVGNKLEGYTSIENVLRNVDFLTAEHYFYYVLYKEHRRAQKQNEGTPMAYDPYYKTKTDALQEKRVKKSLECYGRCCGNDLDTLLAHCVGANTSDLSQEGAHANLVEPNIYPDESADVVKYLENLKKERGEGRRIKVDVLTDNCGLELLSDIELAVFLLTHGLSDSVVFHVRVLPQYVSDVTKNKYVDDFEQLLCKLQTMVSRGMKDYHLLENVRNFLEDGRIRVETNLFWNLPTYYHKHKKLFAGIIGGSDLVIVKGDLNYRKLVGDKNYHSLCWLRRRARELGYPVLALRAVKSSLVDVGFVMPNSWKKRNKIIHNINGLNGDYGIIRFCDGRG